VPQCQEYQPLCALLLSLTLAGNTGKPFICVIPLWTPLEQILACLGKSILAIVLVSQDQLAFSYRG